MEIKKLDRPNGMVDSFANSIAWLSFSVTEHVIKMLSSLSGTGQSWAASNSFRSLGIEDTASQSSFSLDEGSGGTVGATTTIM